MERDDPTVPMEAGSAGEGEPLAPGATLAGRYVILERLGAGGMGVVYAAYDRELDRRVALKLLHPTEDPTARQRLLREAQAMARLTHPNVVTVHDVGEHGGRTFIAMEFVAGESLEAWLRRGPHPWREVVARFLEAGRGLAAAHRAGLVHRDFKPANVLLGRDGRVRVADFGLARATALDEDETTLPLDATTAEALSGASPLSAPITLPGAVVGTPRYMAPEQVLGGRADGRSDQFAFCVALYEALWGRHPYPAPTFAERVHRAAAGRVEPPPARGVPARLRRAVLRGLAARPEDRFESMEGLLDELAHDPAAARRRWLAGAAAGAAAAALVVGVVTYRARREALCSGGPERLAAVWGPGRRARVEAGFAATGLPGAALLAREAVAALDAAGDRWASRFTEVCRASRLRREVSPAVADRQMACLELRLAELDAMARLLEAPDEELATRAAEAVADLPDPATCASAAEMVDLEPLPSDPRRRAAVEAVRERLATADALFAAGRFEAARRAAETLIREGGSGYAPVDAQIRLALGKSLVELGDAGAAEAALWAALVDAERGGARRLAAAAADELAWLYGTVRVEPERALDWSRLAEARLGRLPGARKDLLETLQTRVSILQEAGRLDEALELERRVFSELERLAPDALELARAHARLADALFAKGEYDEAVPHYREAVALRRRALGDRHPEVAPTLVSLGAALSQLGRSHEALEPLREALAIEEAVFGQDSPRLAKVLNNLAFVYQDTGEPDLALATFDRALAIVRGSWGPDHPQAGILQINRAGLLRDAGRLREALAAAREAERIFRSALGPDHPNCAYAHNAAGTLLLDLGRPSEAVRELRRAIRIRERARSDVVERAETRFTLARALWELGSRPEAVREARRALRELEGRPGERADDDRRRVRRWLAGHGG